MVQSFLVALPVRNGGTHLQQCVTSLLQQTFREFQLLVLDNCSTDGTVEWLRQQGDSRISVAEAPHSLGIEDSWARIAKLGVEHEFMTITGHDDLFDPNFLEVTAGLIEMHPQARLYQTHFRLIDQNGTRIRSCMPMPVVEHAHEFLAARHRLRRDSFGTGYVFRSQDYVSLGGIPPHPKLLFADDVLWLKLMEGSVKATHSAECFAYRVHSGSASYSPDWRSLCESMGQYLDFLVSLAESDPKVAAITERTLRDYALYVFRLAYFGAPVHERSALVQEIDVLAARICSMLDGADRQQFRSRVHGSLRGAMARSRWLAWRTQTWFARRVVSAFRA